jgi:hypothetical protein
MLKIEGIPPKQNSIVGKLLRVHDVEHPFLPLDTLKPEVSLARMVDVLQDRKLAVKGEMAWEITEEGCSIRASLRFNPRESLLGKIARVFSIKVVWNVIDLFK